MVDDVIIITTTTVMTVIISQARWWSFKEVLRVFRGDQPRSQVAGGTHRSPDLGIERDLLQVHRRDRNTRR